MDEANSELIAGRSYPPLPDIQAYPNSNAWSVASSRHFARINAQFETIYGREEMVAMMMLLNKHQS